MKALKIVGSAALFACLAGAACGDEQAGAEAARPSAKQASAPVRTQPTESAQHFVQRFYDWYLPYARDPNPGGGWSTVLRNTTFAFDTGLLAALKADHDAQARADDIVGIDFDPFLASQDPCERYEARGEEKRGDRFEVGVYAVCDGRSSDTAVVVAEVTAHDGRWTLVNFRYPPAHEDLVQVLRNFRENREEDARRAERAPSAPRSPSR